MREGNRVVRTNQFQEGGGIGLIHSTRREVTGENRYDIFHKIGYQQINKTGLFYSPRKEG
jgi:hypothetical protein